MAERRGEAFEDERRRRLRRLIPQARHTKAAATFKR